MIEVLKQTLESMQRIDAWLIQRKYTGLMPQEKEIIINLEKAIAELESQEPVAYWKEHAQGLQRDYDSLLADFQAQLEERNFCPRCGKRTNDIHTCTPPQRTWVGLDHHDKKKFSSWLDHKSDDEVFTAIEVKLKEINT